MGESARSKSTGYRQSELVTVSTTLFYFILLLPPFFVGTFSLMLFRLSFFFGTCFVGTFPSVFFVGIFRWYFSVVLFS